MDFENGDESVKDVLKKVVDMVLSDESSQNDKVVSENSCTNTKENSCCTDDDVVADSSVVNEENDNEWTTKHYRLGIAAFLQQVSRPENVSSRKRNMEGLLKKSIHNTSSITTQSADDDKEIPRKTARPQYSNMKEVFREKELFKTKSVDYGFNMSQSCNNYIKSCKWSSSDNYLATTSQDRMARIFTFDREKLKVELKSSMGMGDLIYDSCWHPINDWLATSSKDHPIHVWDSDGQWLTAFRGINSLDELDSAHSLCFVSDGSYLYAGYKSIIRKFDMNRPGCQISELATWNKESRGQKGIISCIAVSPILPTNYAAGSYGKTVGFYSDYSPGVECMFECPLAVTLLRYTPDGNFLLTAGRKDDDIICWDLRHPGKIYSLYRRPATTNQRFYFDIDSSGTYLFSGSSEGDLYIFDLKSTNVDEPVAPYVQFSAHRSALCGLSIQKERPVVATCSGQRVFPFPELDQVDDIDPENKYEDINSPELFDNSLALWSFDE
uniref:WD repeat-containing protein 79 n=1 Tax=Setaria digitata TaxID=48799 RepID=A0A915PMY6_9BILA